MLMSSSVLDMFFCDTGYVLVALSKKKWGTNCMCFVILRRQTCVFKCESEA